MGMTVGGLIPVMLRWDPTGLNGPSLIGGFIGGMVGIWLGTIISRYV